MARPVYRARQFWQAMLPSMYAVDDGLPSRYLSKAEAGLFYDMHRRDQRHALEVAGRLTAAGHTEMDLIAAALLHDCAKLDVPVWLRISRVLAPGLVSSLGRADATGWRGAAYRLSNDSRLSADLAAEAGASDLTTQLIRGETDAESAHKLGLLRAADDAS